MKRFCVFLIRLYQKHLSPHKIRPTCRFYPTCSSYAIEAYEKHGFFGGTYLTVGRVCRCSPLFKGGIDYVPEKISFGKRKNKDNNEK